MATPARHVLVPLMLVAMVLAVRSSDAQYRRPQPKPEKVEASGAIDAVQGNVVRLSTATGQTWFFQFTPKTKVTVTGTAVPEYLRPGLFVEFSADLDRKGTASAPVAELALFTPSPQRLPGLFPVSGIPEAEDAGKRRDPDATTAYRVLGRITSVKDGKLMVNTGRGVVRFELAESPNITVEVADPSVASKGDSITIKGKSVREGFGQADEATIEMAQPLAPLEKPDKRRRKPKRDVEEEKEAVEKPAPTKPAPKSAEAVEEPAKPENASAARVRRIVAALELPEEQAQERKPARIALGPETSEVFAPSKATPLTEVESLLGEPQKTRVVEGMMSMAEGEEPRFVSLRHLKCDGVEVFVNDEGVVEFYRVAP